MIRNLLLLTTATLAVTAASAQTKKVAHRSHSGSVAQFKPSSEGNGFGLPDKETMKQWEEVRKRRQMEDSVAAKKRADSLAGQTKPQAKPKSKPARRSATSKVK
jgi:hypothetical protein